MCTQSGSKLNSSVNDVWQYAYWHSDGAVDRITDQQIPISGVRRNMYKIHTAWKLEFSVRIMPPRHGKNP